MPLPGEEVSETQPRLKLDHAACQSSARLAKVGIIYGDVIGITTERYQVQLIE